MIIVMDWVLSCSVFFFMGVSFIPHYFHACTRNTHVFGIM